MAEVIVGEYNSTPPTAGSGQKINIQTDANGHLLVAGPLGAWQAADADITRPNNTTAYAANGAIGDAGNCIFTFSSVFTRAGGTGNLLAVKLIINKASITVPTGIAIRGHLFNASPSSPPASDQATFQTLLANSNSKLGYIDFTSFVVGGSGSDIIEAYGAAVTGSVMPIKAGADLNLRMVLSSQAAWTPVAQMVFRPYVMAQLD